MTDAGAGLAVSARRAIPHTTWSPPTSAPVRKYRARFRSSSLTHTPNLYDQTMVPLELRKVSPILGDGLRDQAAAVWASGPAGLTGDLGPSMRFAPSTIFGNWFRRRWLESFSRFFGNTFILGDIVLTGAAAASIKPKHQGNCQI